MDKEFAEYHLRVGLECAEKQGVSKEDLPGFLAAHLVNNFEQVQRAKFQEGVFKAIRKSGGIEVDSATFQPIDHPRFHYPSHE